MPYKPHACGIWNIAHLCYCLSDRLHLVSHISALCSRSHMHVACKALSSSLYITYTPLLCTYNKNTYAISAISPCQLTATSKYAPGSTWSGIVRKHSGIVEIRRHPWLSSVWKQPRSPEPMETECHNPQSHCNPLPPGDPIWALKVALWLRKHRLAKG